MVFVNSSIFPSPLNLSFGSFWNTTKTTELPSDPSGTQIHRESYPDINPIQTLPPIKIPKPSIDRPTNWQVPASSDQKPPSNPWFDRIPIFGQLALNATFTVAGMWAVYSAAEFLAPGLSQVLPGHFFADQVSATGMSFTEVLTTYTNVLKVGLGIALPFYAGLDAVRVKDPWLYDKLGISAASRFVKATATKTWNHDNMSPARSMYESATVYAGSVDAFLTEKIGNPWNVAKRYTYNMFDGGLLRIQQLLKDDIQTPIKAVQKADEWLESKPTERLLTKLEKQALDPNHPMPELLASANHYLSSPIDDFLGVVGRFTPKTWGEIAGFGMDIVFNTSLTAVNANFFAKSEGGIASLILPSAVITVLRSYANKEIAQYNGYSTGEKAGHRVIIGTLSGALFGGIQGSDTISSGLEVGVQTIIGLASMLWAYELIRFHKKKNGTENSNP